MNRMALNINGVAMTRWYRLILIIIGVILVQCTKDQPIVARIGAKTVITRQEFREDLSRRQSPEALATWNLSQLKTALNARIDAGIKRIVAYETGLETDSAVVAKMVPVEKEELLRQLWQYEIVDHLITEADIRRFYAHMGREVLVRSIRITRKAAAQDEAPDSARVLADEILTHIREGSTFLSVAQRYAGSTDNQVQLLPGRSLTWTRNSDPVLTAIFSLNTGDVSDVLAVQGGYNIFYVEESRHTDKKPFTEARSEIRQALIQENQNRVNDEASDYWKRIQQENGVHYSEDGLRILEEWLKTNGQSTRNGLLEAIRSMQSDIKDAVILRYNDEAVRGKDLGAIIGELPIQARIPINQPGVLRSRILENWIMGTLLGEEARRKGLHKTKAYLLAISRVRDQEVVNLLTIREIYGTINMTDSDIQSFFQKNQEKYVIPEKVKIQEIMVKDEERAREIFAWARDGRDFSELARTHTERVGYKAKDGVIGPFSRGQWGEAGAAAFGLKVGEITGPISSGNQNGYSVIKLLERIPMQPVPLDDVRIRVIQDMTNQIRIEREAAWLKQKRDAYGVQIYENVLRGTFADSK